MGNVGDTLDGGAGSDNYIVWGNATLVDSAGIDSATAHLDGGSYVLAAGIENLQLISSQQVAVTGNSLDNSIIGSAAADAIDGLAGFDTLNGLGGDDTLAGGAGVDSLWGGAGADEFILDQLGTADADGINDFETGTDQLVLDGSVLTAIGASGEFAPDDMRFYAAAGATSGHDSSDRIIYDTSGLHLWYDPDGSGPAASQLIGAFTSGIDIAAPDFIVIDGTSSGAINGTEGDDTLVGTPGDDTINGLDGNDSISGLEGDDSLSGGDGNDTLAGGPGTDTLDGGFGDDVYVDPAGDVLIDAGGTDTVIGFETSPFLPAGFENLILRGGPFVIGNEDFASSGQGNELDNLIVNERSDPTGLYGEGGNDTLIGSAAADYFVYVGSSDFGHDSVDGGGGFNTFVFEALDTPVTVDFGTGTVTSALGSVSFADVQQALGTSGNDSMVGGDSAVRLFGEDGSDTLVGGAGNDFLDAADYYSGYWSATTGNDSLLGGGGDDTLIGGVGNDFIDGGAGNDQLEAGTFWVDDVGDDTLTGGSGNDTISGGGGADRFVFDQTPGTANADHLTDFASSDDQIHLDATVMTQLGASGAFAVGDARFYAAAGASAGHDADDRVVYDTGSGNLWYDADGSGATAALLIATLDGPAALAATDIVVLNGTTPPSGPIDGTSGDDSLVGTAGDDTINGLEGNDTLMGFGGNDVLDGGPGTDSMDGGAGNDSYYVTAGDVLTDASGVDTVLSDGDWSLGLDFENITLLGTGNWDVQGFNADNLAIGNAGDNYFNMRDGNDTILAGAGDDSIDMSTGGTSSYGNDSIDGGDGTDTVDFAGYARSGVMVNVALGTIAGGGDAGAGSATIANVERVIGGDFNDSFTGDSQGNQFDGRAGDDSLAGGAGNDLLTGGAGADSFLFADVGTANADSVSDFTTGSDEIHLDADAMAALGTSGQFSSADARFYEASGASSGHDADDRVIYDTASGNLWYDADGSGAGSALLIATLQGSASLAATDIFVENGSAPPPPPPSGSIDGTSANDSLVGTTGDDTINGLEGNDTLRGLDGNDVLDGGPGTDLLDGGAGNDTYYVTAGDTLTDSGGVDTVLSGVNWSLGAGFENLTLTGSADLRSGGNDLANLITQNSGDNVTWAGRGDDTILGADGNDYLGGDANNDWLDGQAGNDTLDGGGDRDHFVFSSYGPADADVVRSFATAWDDLEFDASAFSALGAPGDFGSGDARFYAASGASSGHDAADRLIYDTSTGRLYYDDDGSGSHAAQLVATLEGAPSLAASDISVV
ncbi:MAG TPA: hypothetical protein VFV74_02485 [Burkholderiales bacterium]|nr:hypothetical protein [Burkholderiales bacterium]